jgi:hypothetical protein
LVRAAGVAALVVTWALLAAGAAAAATTTTLGFDDLAPGTVVSNQYDAQGVDFQSGIIGINARITGVCCSLCVPWGVG